MKYVSVTVVFFDDCAEPWTAVFSTREKAEEFAGDIGTELCDRGINARVIFDSGIIDSTSYLQFLKERFDEE